jgi:hypothetical protein
MLCNWERVSASHEIADRIYRVSTCVPEAAPGGLTFNQFLVDADDPLLFHTGPRTAKTIRRLATLEPQMLALMHGSSTRTRCSESLLRLADAYDLMIQLAKARLPYDK